MTETWESLIRGVRSKHFPRGQTLLHKGDAPLDVLILGQGVIKLHDSDSDDNAKILHLFRPYSMVPLAFFSGRDMSMQWSYTALTDCDIYALPADELERLMLEDGELAMKLMHWFSLEVHELLVRLNSFSKGAARHKVAAALSFLSARHSKQRRSGWSRVVFPVNQQLMADMTGLTRASAAAIMRELQNLQAIRNPRQTILEINPSKLGEFSAGHP